MGKTGSALSGAAGGALAGSAFGPLGTGIGAVVGGLGGLFGGGGDDIELQDMRTPEQKAAAAQLQALAMTGSGAGLTLGEAYGGPLGNYDMTGLEGQGLTQLASLLAPKAPGGDLDLARKTFANLADTTFDPSDPSTGFAAFSRALAKSGQEASDVLNRESAITGSRFGTGILQRKQDLAENLQLQSAQQLANLFQNSRASQLAGAQGLAGLQGQEFGQGLQLAQASQVLGSLERDLKNQEAQAEFNEFQRQRGEELSRVGLLQGEANRNPYLGVSSIPGSPSPFSSLIGSVLGGVGKGIGTKIGEDGFGSLFNFGKTGATTSVASSPSILKSSSFLNPGLGSSLGGF